METYVNVCVLDKLVYTCLDSVVCIGVWIALCVYWIMKVTEVLCTTPPAFLWNNQQQTGFDRNTTSDPQRITLWAGDNGALIAVEPPQCFNLCCAAPSRMAPGEQLSISVSSLPGLAPAAPFGPLPPFPPGVGVHCRRCYCLFKFTQEPLKEPQGPLVRLPTLKTSRSLKIH